MRRLALLAASCFVVALSGCASYVTPGGPARIADLMTTASGVNALMRASAGGGQPGAAGPGEAAAPTDEIAAAMARTSEVEFPASIALVRVQDPSYRSYTYRPRSSGGGLFTVITHRDIETDEDFARMTALPGVRGVAALNRLLVPERVGSERDLRLAAAQVRADVLLLYTFDTQFHTSKAIPFLGTLSLGVLPSERAHVRSTCSALFMDTRSGFILGLAEATADDTRLTNYWGSSEAVDRGRLASERKAFDELMDEIEKAWAGIVTTHGEETAG